jgi:hypothetical protein
MDFSRFYFLRIVLRVLLSIDFVMLWVERNDLLAPVVHCFLVTLFDQGA